MYRQLKQRLITALRLALGIFFMILPLKAQFVVSDQPIKKLLIFCSPNYDPNKPPAKINEFLEETGGPLSRVLKNESGKLGVISGIDFNRDQKLNASDVLSTDIQQFEVDSVVVISAYAYNETNESGYGIQMQLSRISKTVTIDRRKLIKLTPGTSQISIGNSTNPEKIDHSTFGDQILKFIQQMKTHGEL